MQQEWNQSYQFPQNTVKYQNKDSATGLPMIEPQDVFNKGLEEVLMETSFEENIAEDHAMAIWRSSIAFLKNSLKIPVDENKGFNDHRIFQSLMYGKDLSNEQIDIFQLISKNSILTHDQKLHFTMGMRHQKDLKNLLERSAQLFCQEIFEEMTLIFYEVWEKYSIFKQTIKLSPELTRLLAQSYTDINVQEVKNMENRNYYLHQTENQIISKADQAAYQIAGCYFISTKMRFLNLKQAETISAKSNQIRKEFQTFIETVARGVFLCLEGCFFHPNGQNNITFPTLTSNVSFSESLREDQQFQKASSMAKKRVKF